MVTTNSAMLPLGTTAPDFSLIDTVTGKKVSVTDATGQPLLVAFICNHCPYVKFIQPELARLTSRWLDLGVAVVGISSNDAQAHPDDGEIGAGQGPVQIGDGIGRSDRAEHRCAQHDIVEHRGILRRSRGRNHQRGDLRIDRSRTEADGC